MRTDRSRSIRPRADRVTAAPLVGSRVTTPAVPDSAGNTRESRWGRDIESALGVQQQRQCEPDEQFGDRPQVIIVGHCHAAAAQCPHDSSAGLRAMGRPRGCLVGHTRVRFPGDPCGPVVGHAVSTTCRGVPAPRGSHRCGSAEIGSDSPNRACSAERHRSACASENTATRNSESSSVNGRRSHVDNWRSTARPCSAASVRNCAKS